MTPEAKEAVAIVIGERYFCGFSLAGRVQTAWSLAGAKLFLAGREDLIAAAEARLKKKNKSTTRVRVMQEAA